MIKWKNLTESQRLQNDINVFGKKALECVNLNNEIESLKKYMYQEGLNSNDINQNLSKSLSQNDSLLKRMLSRWILHGTEGFNVKRTLKLWTDFASLRSRLRRAINRLENLIIKPSLESLFRKWVKFSQKERENLKLLNKNQLIDRCVLNQMLKLNSGNGLKESIQMAEKVGIQTKFLREKYLQSLLLALINSKMMYKYSINKGNLN